MAEKEKRVRTKTEWYVFKKKKGIPWPGEPEPGTFKSEKRAKEYMAGIDKKVFHLIKVTFTAVEV